MIRHAGGIGCWVSSLSAPLCLSPPTTRMATNGSRNAAASSHALNVGAHTPTSGENASPIPADVPFKALSSAYARRALMNQTPTSGPISASITHHARDASSSRHSFTSSHANRLRARKNDVLEIGIRVRAPEFRDRPFTAHPAAAEQHESIADAGGVRDLVNRQKQRASGRGMIAKRGAYLAGLAEVETVERLVDQEHGMRRQHADRQHRALALPFRQRSD